MFGYINIYKDELKVKDYNTYRAYYCGLCKALGKNHNSLTRLSLNYDLTFLAILADSISDKPHDFYMSGCVKKIGRRKTIKTACNLDFVSDMNVLLAYFNLKDDIKDSGSLKARIAVLPFCFRARKLKRKYPELCKIISVSLERLDFIEEMQCDIIDKAAHEFAVMMRSIFVHCNDGLGELGYQLGRLVYTMDACDDLADDYRKGNYNPVILQYGYKGQITESIRKQISDNLYFTLAKVAEEYSKIKISKNEEVLENIIYLGIRAKCDDIINERKNQNEKSI